MESNQLTAWADRLHSSASLTLGEDAERGVQEILAGRVGNLRMAQLVATCLGASDSIDFTPRSLDEQLWAALAGFGELPDLPIESTGALASEPEGLAIEVWTEIELASVHAAWSLGGVWRSRAESAAAWLVEHVQPDNATNRPWAVHVFAALASQRGDQSYELYAQTLLHNCQVGSGKPDPFSAMILLHAGNQIQAC